MASSRARVLLVLWAVGLGITIALLGLAWTTSRVVGDAAPVWIMVVLTSIWAAWDSNRVGVQRYRTQMANEPFMVLYLCFTFWPIVFPWYVVVRLAILRGLVAAKAA